MAVGASRPGPLTPARALIAVALIALAVRLLFWWQLGATPFGRTAFLDAAYYDGWAQRIAAGDWLGGREPFFVEPGFLYALAILRALGTELAGVRLVQAGLGAATAVLTAQLARRLSGSAWAALAAGSLVALYGPLVHYEGQLLKTTAEVFAATAVLVLALSPHPRPLAVGAAAGLAIVLKSNFAVVLPALLAHAAFVAVRAAPRERGRQAVAAAAAIGWLLLGAAPPLLATAARNAVVSGEPLLLPWSAGINFYIGNGPEADGLDPTLPFAESAPAREGDAGKREAERRAGRELGYAESSRFWWGESARAIAGDPLRWLGLLADKARLLVHHYEFTDNLSFYFVRERVPVLRALVLGAWLAVALGAVGALGACWRPDPGRLLVLAALALQAGSIVAFHVLDRYRLALVPAALALGVAACAELARETRARQAIALAVGLAAAAVSAFVPPPVGRGGQRFAAHHVLLARDAELRSDHAGAAAELRRAVEENPGVQDFQLRLSLALARSGDLEGARRAEARGLALDPARGPLRLGLLLAEHDPERSAELCLRSAAAGYRAGASFYCAAEALRRSERLAEAELALVRASESAPRMFDAWALLGDVRAERGDVAGAEAAWRQALALRPDAHEVEAKLEAARAPGITPPDAPPTRRPGS